MLNSLRLSGLSRRSLTESPLRTDGSSPRTPSSQRSSDAGGACKECGMTCTLNPFHDRACRSIARLSGTPRSLGTMTPRCKLVSVLCTVPGSAEQRTHALLALDCEADEAEVLRAWQQDGAALHAVQNGLKERLQRRAAAHIDHNSVSLCVEEDVVSALQRGVGTMVNCSAADAAFLLGNHARPPPPALCLSQCYWRLRHALTSLTLHDGHLDALPVAVCELCEALTELDVSNNVFTALPHRFKCAPRLRVFKAARNRIAEFSCDAARAFAALEWLDLSSNRLVALPDAEMRTLRTLDLSDNAALAVPPPHAALLAHLTQLSAQRTSLGAWARATNATMRMLIIS